MPFITRPAWRAGALLLGGLLIGRAAAAQQKPLTIDVAYDPDKKVEFGGSPATGLAWVSDTHFLWPKGSAPVELLKVDAATGRSEPFFDAPRIERALVAEGAMADLARQAVGLKTLAMSGGRTALLMPIGGDLYTYDLASHKAARVTRVDGAEEESTFSPDARQVAFVRGNDLYAVPASGGSERRLTTDGSTDVLNGKLDWVYQEEVYGRGNFRSYWWSPDSRRIAFLRLDEAKVPKYTIVDDITTRPNFEVYPYPKAGDPNPVATLGIVELAGGAPRFADLGKYAGTEILVVDVTWRPDGKVVFQVQDREQTWLDLNVADPATGAVDTLFREKTSAWVEPSGSPRFLKDGSFLWLSERDGWKHLYHYRADGTEPRQVTKGEWEVRTFYGVDEATRTAYFASTDARAIDKFISRVRLDGSGLQRISTTPGQHEANFNGSFTRYLDTWSDTKTPPQVRLRAADGKELRVVDGNDVPALREYRLAPWEFLQVKTRDGFPLEAALLKPPGFDPTKKYPVYQHTYGGPHSPQVRNGWYSGSLFLQLVAEQGVVVFVCDNRSASGKGLVATATAYKRMGPSELRDIEDGVSWLKSQPWVDPQRIGISGWSYGGFITAYALTHSKSFAMGIVGAPVVDWRNYDSIYTERVMRLPKNNEDGYRETSVLSAVKDLHGEVFLIHGTIDDNVHPQNSLQLAYELQKAGKPFRMMMYPRNRHTFMEPLLIKHRAAAMLDFIRETLRPGQ
jgi:dipeptidyl-peptidase-4